MHLDPEAVDESGLSDGARWRLRLIAETLGCATSDFFSDGAGCRQFAGATELLELWNAIGDDAGRERLLACARDAAAGSRATSGAEE